MDSFSILALYFVVLTFQEFCIGENALRYYETLKSSDIKTRVKRDAGKSPEEIHSKQVTFSTLGRTFNLYLTPSKILSHDFRASIVKGNGQQAVFKVNNGAFYTGVLEDDVDAKVNAHWEADAMMANIITKDDIYVIEPSWRNFPKSDNHSMVAYRFSDLKRDGTGEDTHSHSSFCGIKEGGSGSVEYNDMEKKEFHGQVKVDEEDIGRKKRQSPSLQSRTICRIMVVADHTFFENMGGKSEAATAGYLINLVEFVNNVYTSTQFDAINQQMKGIGFEIAEMRIHNGSTSDDVKLQNGEHYNQNKEWVTKDLLEAFSRDIYFDNFCLAHLFTYRVFSNGVLGLAYIASDRVGTVGGICSPLYPKYQGVKLSLNTGWSSSRNSQGRLLALQASIVTVHELGHNMGSEHDPETDECAPSERDGGKFVMYPWAVSGYERNNQKFSPCSREYIFQVARAKGYNCFSEKTEAIAFCGNGRVDAGETCDEGWETSHGKGQCCDEHCQLRPGAKCSPMNYQCCYNCQPASRTQVCRLSLPLSCQGPVSCDGTNVRCPNITKPLHNISCIDEGICQNGECRNFCQQQNRSLEPCICSKESGSACHRCCRPASDEEGTECKSYSAYLPDGRPCFQGTCSHGICVKQRQDMVQRLFDIIESITIDQVVAFMKSNIVGTVIVISLFLWIPASCAVSYIDRKRERQEKQARLWKSKSNRALFLDEDRSRIRRIPNLRTSRHPHGSVVRHVGNENETVL